MTGKVYLVGAGPGDPGLLTIKGRECLRKADVVIYDRLVHPELLNHCKSNVERVFAGKEASHHTLKQNEINAIIIDAVRNGKTVCRLKGGDPFVLGRGGEEAEACADAGLDFEIVPGVSAAIAVPAYAGIPVTHRETSSSFAVIAAHKHAECTEPGTRAAVEIEDTRDWAKIAHAADTLIFLMGVENVEEIASQLMRNGRDPETPVALVRWGTWAKQETIVSILGKVVEDVKSNGLKPPAVIVVGGVVNLRERLRWFDRKPLFGKRVLVTRAREQASALSDLLREHGAESVEFPVIKIVPPDSFDALDEALNRLPGLCAAGQTPYHWVIFTSANGVRFTAERLKAMSRDARAFGAAKIAAIGSATEEALADIGITADFVPSEYVAEAIIDEWPDPQMDGKRVLIPRAKDAREVLPEVLRKMGAVVDVVPAYKTIIDAELAGQMREELLAGSIDAVTFTSSSTVRNFVECIGEEDVKGIRGQIMVAAIGPITAQTAAELGLTPDIAAEEHTIPGLVQALADYYSKTNG